MAERPPGEWPQGRTGCSCRAARIRPERAIGWIGIESNEQALFLEPATMSVPSPCDTAPQVRSLGAGESERGDPECGQDCNRGRFDMDRPTKRTPNRTNESACAPGGCWR
jgi:hypothetical protein